MALRIDLSPYAGKRVCVALSGGADSVALFLLLREGAERFSISLSAVNVEHGIRGEQSLADTAFVRELCAQAGVPLFCFSAQIPARAAITGHLVFSTLHTNDAPGAVIRLEDMKVTDYLVADAVVGVIAQRLVKRLCPACKKRGRTNEAEMKILGLSEPASIFRPQGCQFCNNTGYKGRIAVHEIMYMSDAVKSAVIRGVPLEDLRKLAEENGMVNLWDSGKSLVLKGITDVSELMTLFDD